MKYVLCDRIKNGDLFTEEFADKEEAMEQAAREWDWLTETDKKRRDGYFLIESDNPDEGAENHLEGNIIGIWK